MSRNQICKLSKQVSGALCSVDGVKIYFIQSREGGAAAAARRLICIT